MPKRPVHTVWRTFLAASIVLLTPLAVTKAAITVRTQEPVVMNAAFPDFAGIPVNRIRLYAYVPTSPTDNWVEVPFQIDQRKTDTLDSFYPAGGGCKTGAATCEFAVDVSGSEGDYHTVDQAVFMARDTGSLDAGPSVWLKTPNVDTLGERYRVTVKDNVSGELGVLYAYAWLRDPDQLNAVDSYVTWDPDPTNQHCQVSNPPDPACGWLRATDATSSPRFDIFFSGNWTAGAFCVKPFSSDASCSVDAGGYNFFDETKYATTGPRETSWGWDSACRALIGVKVGPVRAVRRIVGALSGRYTTKTEYFYGTWFQQVINLRVHPILTLAMQDDHRAIGLNPLQPDTPTALFTESYSQLNGDLPMDSIDLTNPGTIAGTPDDWVQVDFGRGTYVQFLDYPRAIRDSTRTFLYDDAAAGVDKEYQAGHFGQYGVQWTGSDGGCLPDTEDSTCYPADPNNDYRLQYAQIVRTMIPLNPQSPDSMGDYHSFAAEHYAEDKANPLIANAFPEEYTVPIPAPGTPCVPTLSGSANDGGFSTHLEASDSCSPVDAAGTEIFRGPTAGMYTFLADIGSNLTFDDTSVSLGVTYHYIARVYNRDGVLGPPSTDISVNVTDTVPPPVPTGVTATAGNHMVIVSWTPDGNRDTRGVYVNMSTQPGGPYAKMNAGAPSTCQTATFAVMNLTPGTTYYFTATAVDFAGNESPTSLEVSATPTN